jgi:hypothetical protein
MTLAILAAFAVATYRVALYYMGRPAEGTDLLFIHFMAIVTIVFFTNKRMVDRQPSVELLPLIRSGFRNAAVYSVLTGLFIWLHYNTFEAGHFQQRVEDIIAGEIGAGAPEDVVRPRVERFFTPFNYASLTFFALLLAGGINALLIAMLHYRVLRRFRQ